MTSHEWRKWFAQEERWQIIGSHMEFVESLHQCLKDMEQLEYEVEVYHRDRLTLITRIGELQEQLDEQREARKQGREGYE